MKAKKLNRTQLEKVNGGSGSGNTSAGIGISAGTDSLFSVSSEYSSDGRTEKRELSIGNGIDLDISTAGDKSEQ